MAHFLRKKHQIFKNFGILIYEYKNLAACRFVYHNTIIVNHHCIRIIFFLFLFSHHATTKKEPSPIPGKRFFLLFFLLFLNVFMILFVFLYIQYVYLNFFSYDISSCSIISSALIKSHIFINAINLICCLSISLCCFELCISACNKV